MKCVCVCSVAVMDACCRCMFDILKQAVVNHMGSVYNVDSATQCTVVIRKYKSDDSDICVTFGRQLPDSNITVSTQQHSVTAVIYVDKVCNVFTSSHEILQFGPIRKNGVFIKSPK